MEAYSILTCKLNKNTINCFDGTYPKEQLKKWAMKNILLCPVCYKPYEYCHGRIATPYFRHKDKQQCEYLYNEPETQEHVKGKQILFEWISKQEGVSDVILEGWIPETKQRPDIMFNYDNKQYVIEFQCTPIASEYLERHDLYKAGGINDIWILGTEKFLGKTHREKSIQNHTAFYLNVDDYSLLFFSSIKDKHHFALLESLPQKMLNYSKTFFQLELNSMYFYDGTIYIKEDILLSLIKKHEELVSIRREAMLKKAFKEVLKNIRKHYSGAKISDHYNNSIELDEFNLFFSRDNSSAIYTIELKKRKFKKVKCYKSNKSRWECYFKNISMKRYAPSELNSKEIIEFVLLSMDNYKAVK